MAKKTNTSENASPDTSIAGLTPPVSLETFQDDVTDVFLHYVRNVAWMVDNKTAWAITKLPALEREQDLGNCEYKAADLGLHYEHIQETEFAKAMQRMYDFAYFGQIDLSGEALNYESIHTWTTALVLDVAEGSVASEWGGYGLDIQDCARRCEQVCETANARRILEGKEHFYLFGSSGKDDYCGEGMLNVRQVALLSSMEEMSIRAAANPSRANQLKPTKTEYGTRFEISVVKEWLIQKKRYVPLTKRSVAGDMNLAKKSFGSLTDLMLALDARYNKLGLEKGYEQLDAAMEAMNVRATRFLETRRLLMDDALFANDDAVRSLARVLSLPEELLLLRAKEAIAVENLKAIELALKEQLAGQ